MAKFKGAIKFCVVCDKEFKVPSCRATTAICCSRKCKDAWWKTSEKKTATLACKGCGKNFKEYFSHVERRVYCSRSCQAKHLVRPDISGDKNPIWNGGKALHASGYKYVMAHGHPFPSTGSYVFEHRLTVERWLRQFDPESIFLVEIKEEKYLDPRIVVHHKDHDKLNNHISNLECMTQSAHRTLHHNDPVSIQVQITNLQKRLQEIQKE